MGSSKVKRPRHYIIRGVWVTTEEGKRIKASVELGDLMDVMNPPFWVSFAIKYLWRSGRKEKDMFLDVQKAAECCNRFLQAESEKLGQNGPD